MKYAILTIILICTSCSTTNISKFPNSKNKEEAEVYIYRTPSFAAGGSKAIFGANIENYVVLGNGDYSKLRLKSGQYNFFVKDKPFMDLISIKGDPYSKEISLRKRDKKCLSIYPNKKKIVTDAVIGIPSTLGSIFKLEEIQCPKQEGVIDGKQYKLQSVQYE